MKSMKKIVIVEDERFMREELWQILSKAGYEVSCITSFTDTVEKIKKESPDFVLLDLNLPGTTGFEICRELKRESAIPVLVLTSRDRLDDELHALKLGADEYLTKPCHKERLLLRVANLMKRYEGRNHMLERNGILLDRQTYTLYADNQSMLLPQNQGKLLEILMMHAGEIVGKEALTKALWGTTEYIDENALQVNLTRLKKTLEKGGLGQWIQTVRGEGYSFVPAGIAAVETERRELHEKE